MNYTVDFDNQLYDSLKAGSEKAFVSVFEQYYCLLYALAYRYFKSEAKAEDAVQYTLMQLWEQRESFDFSAGLRSLLFTILKNHILNELRHQNIVFSKHYELAQRGEEIEEDLMQKIENKDFHKHLYAAIEQLPMQKRKICLMKIKRGLSNQEIAEKLHITVPTVKSHYTQAIKQLRGIIGKLILILFLC